ncbi:MAG: DCC1-like thiol-disulfide oxidoreductase family protein [Bacteroidales bacterium]|jgi:predicted DCC family thiol-disulfide oxidoreductase YuxK|nr:DCC1-like thiol-disulfide oxidoreductase family protein [Bacteroidales bacterium]
MNKVQAVLAYDGVCNLCNALVRFVIRYDKTQKIHFVSLQSNAFRKYFPNETVDMKTLYFYYNGKVYKRSDAILQVFKRLGGGWKAFLIFYVFPQFFRDAVYRGIAKSRYRIFGRTDKCQLPDERYANRFLD